MTVEQLMELLEEMEPEAEVKIAYQPNYPMEATIDTIKEVDGTVYIRQDPYAGNDYAPAQVYEETEEY